jgi:hypothetical protein
MVQTEVGAVSHLRFDEILPVSTRTKQWVVLSASSRQSLGEIRWWSPWRRYCFYATVAGAIFDAECLMELRAFLQARMQERK